MQEAVSDTVVPEALAVAQALFNSSFDILALLGRYKSARYIPRSYVAVASKIGVAWVCHALQQAANCQKHS